MSIADHPKDPGPFALQHGYNDIKAPTAKYHDRPEPIYYGRTHNHPHLQKVLGKMKDFALS